MAGKAIDGRILPLKSRVIMQNERMWEIESETSIAGLVTCGKRIGSRGRYSGKESWCFNKPGSGRAPG